MLSKNPSKEHLRQLLEAQCENAMLLDNSVRTLYAAEPGPPKSAYRPRKKRRADAYELEIQRLSEARDNGAATHAAAPAPTVASPIELDFQALEVEVAAFMRDRRRK